MIFKYACAVIAMALVLAFLLPPLVKLKEVDLAIAILIGIAMMLIDLWQSLQSKDD
jgi:hypothetical protein